MSSVARVTTITARSETSQAAFYGVTWVQLQPGSVGHRCSCKASQLPFTEPVHAGVHEQPCTFTHSTSQFCAQGLGEPSQSGFTGSA